jgi:signal transduction histidine kinase
MSSAKDDSFEQIIAARIDTDRHALATRWLERLLDLIPVPAGDVFPADALLDHIPHLIHEIAKFIAVEEREIAANTFVVAKARELGVLRHEQHASVHQLLREYELLRNILETFVEEQAERLGLEPDLADVLQCVRRINQAVAILTLTTVDTFVERYAATIDDQTRRLERFNQMVSHELRQPLGVLQTAASLLQQSERDGDSERRRRVIAAMERNVTRVVDLLGTITKITALHAPDDAKPGVQRVSLSTVAQEAARQLREMFRDRTVEIVIAPDLPSVTVDVGRLELMFSNLFSNAIKYSDPSKPHRYVEVSLVELNEPEACTFRVRDNGLGMTPEQVRQVFTPFFRAHAERDTELGVEGLGLGLSIVRDCAEAIGASIRVDSAPGEGTTFTVRMPVGTSLQ